MFFYQKPRDAITSLRDIQSGGRDVTKTRKPAKMAEGRHLGTL